MTKKETCSIEAMDVSQEELIVVEVWRGFVTNVYSNAKEKMEVRILDWDGDDEDNQKELKSLAKNMRAIY